MKDWFEDKLDSLGATLAGCAERPESTALRESGLPGQRAIVETLDLLMGVLYPGCHGPDSGYAGTDAARPLRNVLREIGGRLFSQISGAFAYAGRISETGQGDRAECRARARAAVGALFDALPAIRTTLDEDAIAGYEGDPAATSKAEVILSYPGFFAIAVHRIAHVLYAQGVPIIPRAMSEYAHSKTGIDIHPGATIGPGFFIDHGTGVVIGETCTIGRHVKLYQGVTLGARSFPKNADGTLVKGLKRHPDVEDDVVIYAGATVLGGETVIGRGAVIGASVWVTSSIPPGEKVLSSEIDPSSRKARVLVFDLGAGI